MLWQNCVGKATLRLNCEALRRSARGIAHVPFGTCGRAATVRVFPPAVPIGTGPPQINCAACWGKGKGLIHEHGFNG